MAQAKVDLRETRRLLKKLARISAQPKSDDDVPTMVETVQVAADTGSQTYEEANWAKLSPMFRRAHNKLRIHRGLSPIPDPKVDQWVPPRMKTAKFDPTDREAVAVAQQFLRGQGRMMVPGEEGFKDRGTAAAPWLDP